jgi:hypothetical protein
LKTNFHPLKFGIIVGEREALIPPGIRIGISNFRNRIIKRNKSGRYARSTWNWFVYQIQPITIEVIMGAVAIGIVSGIFISIYMNPIVESAEASEIEVVPREVRIEVIKEVIVWTPETIEAEIRRVFVETPNTAVAVAKSESGSKLLPTAYNPEAHRGCNGSYGVFQVACVHNVNNQLMFDPALNIKRAHELWLQSGWGIWGGYSSGGYKKFL